LDETGRIRRNRAHPSFDEGRYLSTVREGGENRVIVLFTEEEAARILRMSVRQLANRRRARKIECIRDGVYVAYSEKNLRDFCKSLGQPCEEPKSPPPPPPSQTVKRAVPVQKKTGKVHPLESLILIDPDLDFPPSR